eukprot:jgi/Mesvir1/20971/Mv08038-RA.1
MSLSNRNKEIEDPSNAVNVLISRRAELEKELKFLEKQVYDLETSYLESKSSVLGSVLKGYEGYLQPQSSLQLEPSKKRQRMLRAEERLFSLSSVTSLVNKPVPSNHADAPIEPPLMNGKARNGLSHGGCSKCRWRLGGCSQCREKQWLKRSSECNNVTNHAS